MRLSLLSNSASQGRPYLEHALEEIRDIAGSDPIAFVPFAMAEQEDYIAHVRLALAPLGNEVIGVPRDHNDALRLIDLCGTVFVGGGNTFRLLKALQDSDLTSLISGRVIEGSLNYLGSSAGTNVACPTIRTTNDMPIVFPVSSDALCLVPFQINPHYVDHDPRSKHMGESREQRISEFLEENDSVVVGLREGSWLALEERHLRLRGMSGAVIFERHTAPLEVSPGADLSQLLETESRFDTPMPSSDST